MVVRVWRRQFSYPRVLHQRCWVHKMRNITEHARKGDREELKHAAQAIYKAENRKQARVAFRYLKLRWQSQYPSVVRQLEKDLPDLLSFFSFPNTCGGSCGLLTLSCVAL